MSSAKAMPATVGGAVCVFAKCPIPGRSKTRIAPLLGEEGAALLATAMLSDILVSISACAPLKETLKVLVYAPGSSEGESIMRDIINSLELSIVSVGGESPSAFDGWVLLPMASGASKSDLTSTSLGSKLEDALNKTRILQAKVHKQITTNNSNQSVLFLGMDAPELLLDEIIYGLESSSRNKAHMCPADDGGYGMLSVPKSAESSHIFRGVRWSNSLTAISQLKALSDSNVDISIGAMMNDVDMPDDVIRLAKRLVCKQQSDHNDNDKIKNDVLMSRASGIEFVSKNFDASSCQYTWKALNDLKVITKTSDGKYTVNSTIS